MVTTPRAYITPGEYCVFYLHHRRVHNGETREDYNQIIGTEALDALKAALLAINKTELYDQVAQFKLIADRVHTIDPENEDAPLLSLVVVELPEPVQNTSWEVLIQALYSNGPEAVTALDMYNQLRTNILKTVMSIYNPTGIHYKSPLEKSDGVPVDISPQVNVDYYQNWQSLQTTLLQNNIVAISPNWLVAPSPNSPPPVDSGGPGAEPDLASPSASTNLDFVALDGSAPWWRSGSNGDDVHVAIFDSIPEISTIVDARTVLMSSPNDPGAKLYTALFGLDENVQPPTPDPDIGDIYEFGNLTLIYDGGWNVLPPPAAAPSTTAVSVPDTTIAKHNYPMSDHGTFIASIVRSIVPDAHIYVIQVLNKYGVGNLESVWCGFARYWNYWRAKYLAGEQGNVAQQQISMHDMISNLKMVFNCSLAFDTPPMHDLSVLEVPPLTGTETEQERRAKITQTALFYGKVIDEMDNDDLFRNQLNNVIDSRRTPVSNSQIAFPATVMTQLWPSFDGLRYLFADQFFGIKRVDDPQSAETNLHILTAAAGNNCEENGLHPAALFPASDPLVVGVGALEMSVNSTSPAQDEQIAPYSNLADTPMQSGFYVFGGNAPGQSTVKTSSAPPTTAGKGIIGLYLDNLPSGATSTGHGVGLAEWAGTSFATPILTGILAGLLGDGDERPLGTIQSQLQAISAVIDKTEADVAITASGNYSPVTMQIIQVKQNR